MTKQSTMPARPSAEATLSLLWERIRRQGDMPGFTKAIQSILSAMRGEDDVEFSMTQTVLSDPVLTQKVLRLANSSMYAAFGQHINTASKAIMVLGTDAIGHLALGLKLIEELASASPKSEVAQAEMEKAVLAGMVAQQVASSAASADPEEAVVCSMLHKLGRMMVTFYMPERWAELQEQAERTGEPEAALNVLGLPLERIGRATAEHWGLPKNLLEGMRTLDPADGGAGPGGAATAPAGPRNHADWLAAVSTMASRCADSLWHDDEAGAAAVQDLVARYAPLVGVEVDGILAAIDRAKTAAAADLSIAPLARPAEKRAQELASARIRAEGNKILLSGVADMREVLGAVSAGQMLTMALETVYQGLSFSRAVAFLRNRREHCYSAKMAFGAGAKELIPAMKFDDAYEPNVFHASLGSDRVIFIENARDPKFAAKLPAWWKSTLLDARAFVVLPMCVDGQPVGFIYGDWDDSFPAIVLSQTEFALMNDLRALVVKNVEQRQRLEAATRTD